jgi:WD40 repeat protein
MSRAIVFPLALLIFLLFSQAHAQNPCDLPLMRPNPQANIFSPQQELDLGDAMAERSHRDFRVIRDPDVTGHLQEIGEKLVKNLPLSDLRFQFLLVDLPFTNAFTIAGGRVYVTRKLVAMTRSEDELAGVLGHELGHALHRDPAVNMTRRLREVLNVTQVGDRDDIFEKYDELLDNWRRKPGSSKSQREDSTELDADRVGVIAVLRSGYSPQAVADLWDRLAGTKGRTGNWLSDLFGTTDRDSKRLREMLRTLSIIPTQCRQEAPTDTAARFKSWQGAVVGYRGVGHKEQLHSVISRQVLDPPLRSEVTRLRFSPNGRYLLAQDDVSIDVLSRDPLQPLFRIDAVGAHPAQFTPDSSGIVFADDSMRVESWSIPDEERISVQEMSLPFNSMCLQTRLSPDGKVLACLSMDRKGDLGLGLSLLDVATGEPIWEKTGFVPGRSWTFWYWFQIVLPALLEPNRPETHLAGMGFSPDGRYFAAGHGDYTLAFDLSTKTAMSLPGTVRHLMDKHFTFLAPDTLAGEDPGHPTKSAVVRFPSGERITEFTAGNQDLWAPTKGNYLLIGPLQKYPLGVLDLGTGKMIMASNDTAVDIYEGLFARVGANGEIGLIRLSDKQIVARTLSPLGPLGALSVGGVSSDFNWLAISEKRRGALWNLKTGQRLFYIRGFRGVYFGADGTAYAQFPKYKESPRSIGRLDLNQLSVSETAQLDEDSRYWQEGRYLVVTKANERRLKEREKEKEAERRKAAGEDKSGWKPEPETTAYGEWDTQNVTVEFRDVISNTVLWSRYFPRETPVKSGDPVSDRCIFRWPLKDHAAKDAIASDPELRARSATLRDKEGGYYVEVVENATGKIAGKLLVDTGKASFHIADILSAGDRVVIQDNQNRVLVYSLSTGKRLGHFFGTHPALRGNLLAVENERGQVLTYDLTTMQRRDEFLFSKPISLVRFSTDTNRLFVLTSDQTYFILDVGGTGKGESRIASSNQ